MNNGLNSFIGNNNLFEGNNITVEKVKLSAFYQPSKYYCSHDVSVLSNNELNKENSLFIATMIGRQGTKYSYGRQAQMNVVKKETLFCPTNEKNEPDYEYMENYTKSIIDKKVEIYKKYIQNVLAGLEYKEIEPLENKEWKEFFIVQNNMYQLVKCKTLTTTDLDGKEGILDVVGATTKNNGNVFFANKKYKEYEINKNAICLIKTGQGSVGKAVYKGNNFIPSNNVAVLTKNNLNIYTGLFTTTLINKCNDRYSYGYIRNDKRIQREKIMLPINENNEPDFEYMEQYMKNIMYKKIMQYLNYKNKEA